MEPLAEAEIPGLPVPESASDTRKLQVSQVALPPAPVHPFSGDSEVIKDMAEADTLRQLSRSGGVRLIKRDFFATAPSPDAAADPVPPAATPVGGELGQPEAETAPTTSVTRAPFSINLAGPHDPSPPGTVIFRRRTKMADVARIVLPPRREEPVTASPTSLADTSPLPSPTQPPPETSPPTPESASTIFPASFPVSMPTGGVLKSQESSRMKEDPVLEKKEAEPFPAASEAWSESVPEAEKSTAVEAEDAKEDSFPKATEERSVDSENSNLEPGEESKPEFLPAPSDPERKEFVLSNGERILGHILSETTDCIYVNHSTLGVLTIPRAQIAQRPVEIILINGDRIVGDILAETGESLFVRHASLGVLTVPKNQRSTRVVEAILKDGDRILGEVLGETGNFTVIRSATLGTVAVPHNRVAMLNRRAEEVQMKSLPLGDKPQA